MENKTIILCDQEVERHLRQDLAMKIMESENITLGRYKKIYNPEVDFFKCGNKAKYKVIHHINIKAEERVAFVCGVHKNQLVNLSNKARLPIIVEKL